ncbi:MAG: hypothetical protein J6Y04_10135 [Bacteroidaceae bacterium]|nr:hypothetical protein [Bacteroidaceae bacterium]
MKKDIKFLLISLFFAMGVHTVQAQVDYTTYFTSERGFTEVTSTSDLLTGNYYYALCSAENTELYVGICNAGDRKAGWAPDNSLAMCYQSAVKDPVLNRKNFWIIEKSGDFIGFRNLYHNVCLFQTNEGQGYLYFAGFYWEHDMSEWDCLTPSFQNGYWTFESGKYPISSGDWASGFLGPWDKEVKEGETMALNRKNTEGDMAGHYRLFRIPKATFESLHDATVRAAFPSASFGNPVDATYYITNPSFETGDMTGWTMMPAEGNDMGARDYTLTGMEGKRCGNFYCWWNGVSVEQTISNLPNGTYKISALVGTWEDRYSVNFTVNDNSTSVVGRGADVGIEVSHTITLDGTNNSITIKASRDDVDWWSEGRGGEEHPNDPIGFFKIDDVRLKYYGYTPLLPNDESTILTPNIWYYYDAPVAGRYMLTGNLLGMVYSEGTPEDGLTGNPTKSELGFPAGRIYFKTTRNDATLKVEPANAVNTFSAATLNVDGLPTLINSDGPGSNGTKLISTYLNNNKYDIVAIQEDFDYDSELKSNISGYTWGTFRGSVNLTNLISAANTDGMEFATRNATASFANESYVQFTSTTSTDGNQYIKKGYRYYEVTLASGDKLDVFITHMDAGGENAIESCAAQLRQIANAIINKGNTDRPKIFMGDTNCRYTRNDIKANFFDILASNYDVSDVWVELAHNNVYPTVGEGTIGNEVVDKILYINPKGSNKMKLTPISYVRDTANYVNDSGNPLGDHAPVVVQFGLSLYEEVDNTLIFGDVNKDGEISIADVTALVNIILGKDNIQPYQYDHVAADVNQDGDISIADVTALVNIILGKQN